MGSFVIDTGQKISKEEEYWKNYHLMHNHEWERYIVENGPNILELMTVTRKMVDRITEDEIPKGERVLRIRGALHHKHSMTLSLKNLKKYGNWNKTRETLLDLIKEVDELEVEEGPTIEEVDAEIQKYRDLIE